MTLKTLIESLSIAEKEQLIIEELANLPLASRRRICQQLELVDMKDLSALDVANLLEMFVQRRRFVRGVEMLREEITNYLCSLKAEEKGTDLQLFLERSLALLERNLSMSRLKALAIQIKGQLTFDLDGIRLADPWYWSFRKNPPHKLLEVCQFILQF